MCVGCLGSLVCMYEVASDGAVTEHSRGEGRWGVQVQ